MTNSTDFAFLLGSQDELAELVSYPNTDQPQSLQKCIEHYLNSTLKRDGFSSEDVTASIECDGDQISVRILAPLELRPKIQQYESVLKQFLDIGREALNGPIQEMKQNSRWDPKGTGKWRFFLPLGLSMIEYRSIQFFHYPPLRLLNVYQDYLNDPVPYRWEQLLEFNGVPASETPLYERYIDAAPIAAPDDQGAYIPVDAFTTYQRKMTELFLNSHTTNSDYTVPIVVFGIPAMNSFEHLFYANLDILVPQTVEIVKGKKTAVLGATHPYHFYAQAQIDDTQFIGAGKLGKGCQLAELLMKQDLIAARWQSIMSKDPTLNPGAVLNDCTAYWLDPAKNREICQLVQHQGSMRTFGKDDLQFDFTKSLDAAAEFCSGHSDNPSFRA